ncbi:MFS transporter [Pseudomonas sp. LB-090624]|uniref:MFS transporter n=1 Tax=Pseudomonas sp. LB-090624 TaxID=2213079 RepID=UPI000D8DF39C|nr:MFS transporter [Pseudomonas sp. LB-090624]PYB78559.1 MFS transporter [Pseudomonas sp. LB-090624]
MAAIQSSIMVDTLTLGGKFLSAVPEVERLGLLKIGLLGILQILSWGGSFYLLGVLADPISKDTGWSHQWVISGASVGLLTASLLTPFCARMINAYGGRRVLAVHSVLLAVGLLALATSVNIYLYLGAWVILGAAMAAGLYGALFTSLGAIYGMNAKPVIVGITLISGFCTTVIWPLLAFLDHLIGWRLTCGIFSLFAVAALLPLYRYALPTCRVKGATATNTDYAAANLDPITFWIMTSVFAIAAALMTCISIVLITVLQARGFSLASSIALAALIGPAQVLCRVADLLWKRQAPVMTALLASGMTAVGLFMVDFAPSLVALGLACYGAGNGMRAIVKTTLPMVVVRPEHYVTVSGRLNRPALLAQALAPIACGYVISNLGSDAMIHLLSALALLAFGLTVALSHRIEQTTR